MPALETSATTDAVALPGRFEEFWQAYRESRGALIGLALVVLLVLLAVFADVVSPYPPNEQYRDFTLTPPAWDAGGSARFLLGTDPVGRDMLSRLIHGTRLSL
ncbi:MAG: dipeptide ABC transporter permease DppC, partial [Casimicrobiaceae bacterium]